MKRPERNEYAEYYEGYVSAIEETDIVSVLCEQPHELRTAFAGIPEEKGTFAYAEGKWTISRFKGLGEMSAEQLWETTLNPDTRRLLPVQLGKFDFAGTESLITKLMGKGEAAARRELMELHGDAVEVDV